MEDHSDSSVNPAAESASKSTEEEEEEEDTAEPQVERESMTEIQKMKMRCDLSEAADVCGKVTLKKIEKLEQQMKENYISAQEQVKGMISEILELVGQKQVELLRAVEEAREIKEESLAERRTFLTGVIGEATKLLEEDGAESESSARGLVERGPGLLSSLSSPLAPHSSHDTAHPGLGFSAYLQGYITEALRMCMWVGGEGVSVGERMVVSAVGGLQPNGSFWVRQVTHDPIRQECALQLVSNALGEVHQSCAPLDSCSPGQLCVAQFSQDGRWYRAVVVSIPSPGTAKYFFLDHGGSEEAAFTSLYPLPDQFRALHFQMIHVRLTTNTSVNFDTREMRWRFTDYTHRKTLVAEVLSLCEVDEAGPVYLIHMEDHTQAEPFDVGKILVASAELKETPSSFKSRDVRFKNKRAEVVNATPTMTSLHDQPPAPAEEPTATVTTSSIQSGSTVEVAGETTVVCAGETTVEVAGETTVEVAGETTVVGAGETTVDVAGETTVVGAGETTVDGAGETTVVGVEPQPQQSVSGEDADLEPPGGLSGAQTHSPIPSRDSAITQDLPPEMAGGTDHPSLPLSPAEPHTSPTLSPSPPPPPTSTPSPPPPSPPTSTPSPPPPPPTSTPSPPPPPPPTSTPSPHPPAPPTSTPSPHPPPPITTPSHLAPDSLSSPSPPNSVPDTTSPHTITQPDSIPHSVQEPAVNHEPIPHSRDSIPEEPHAIPQPKTLRLGEVEGVLLSNETPPTDDATFNIDTLHPCVQPGARLSVEVTTGLSSDGSFWCQLLFPPSPPEGAGHGAVYTRQQEELQEVFGRGREEGEAFTPVFYHEGDICASCFSEDEEWYRARIEKVFPGTPHVQFTVRYLDFGNLEERLQHQLKVLGSKFKLLPPGGIHCSIATDEHLGFTQGECEAFEQLLGLEGVYVEVLAVEREVSVKLLNTSNNELVDVREQLLSANLHPSKPPETADRRKLRRQWSSSTDLDTPTTTHVSDWAAHMEDQPEDTVFLTLPGHESSRETTPSLREATPTNRETTPTVRGATPTNEPVPSGLKSIKQQSRGTTPTRPEATPTRQEVTKQDTTPSYQRATTPTIRAVSPIKPIEATPTRQEATPTVRRDESSLATTHHTEATPTQQEAPPTQRDSGPSQWVPLKTGFLQRVPNNPESTRPSGRKARLDLNRAKHTIFSSLATKTGARPPRQEDSDGPSRVRGWPKHHRTDQRKLYVKCPVNTSDSQIRELFRSHGDVLEIECHTTDPTVLYVVMDVKGAEEAVVKMNGYQVSPGHKLIVERYRNRSPSPSPPLSTTPPSRGAADVTSEGVVRLFVKNVSSDHNPASLRTVFSRYGRVVKMLPDQKRWNVTYVYMDAEGGTRAINNLHGKAISKNGKPLVVELSHEPKNR